MKLTPLGKMIIVVALLVAAFFSVRRFAPGLKTWALGKKGGEAHTETVDKGDFDALGNAPADPERGKGSEGVAPASGLGGSGKLDRPLVVGINTWAGHAPGIVANGGLDPSPAVDLQEEVRPRRRVRPPRGPGRQARRLHQGRHRHHVGHRRLLRREASSLAEQNIQAKSIIQAGLEPRR